MPLLGLVLNRVTVSDAVGLSAERAGGAAAGLREQESDPTLAGLLEVHAERMRRIEREKTLIQGFAAVHPTVRHAVSPALAGDVHDLDGLRQVGEALART
jgi:hypothetical protein